MAIIPRPISKLLHLVFQVLLACILVIMPLSGCQQIGGGTGSTSNDTLNLWDSGPLTLDPAISGDMGSHTYIMQVFSGLVRLNSEMEVVPDIAERWEQSPDGTIYTFYLREGVQFHSGKEVTATDFQYSWERACDPATGSTTATTYLGDILGARQLLSGEIESLTGVKVIEKHILEITIDAPRADFLCKLTYPTAFVINQENVAAGKYWWRNPDGTGPFRLAEWQEGQALTLARNELYYGEKASLEQATFHLLTGNPMSMYELGEIDVVPVYTAYIDMATDPQNPFSGELSITPELSLYYLGFNTSSPPFDDINVRHAFCLAVDRERIARVILRGMVSVAGGILPPGLPGYNTNLTDISYDAKKARELIAASSYGSVANLPPVILTIGGYGNDIPAYLGAIIQAWQLNLGVEVQLRQLEQDAFLYHLQEEKDGMFATGWIADYPDPHNFLDILFRSGSDYNYSAYSNPALDALLDRAAIEQDEATRFAMYREAEQIVLNDAPCLPLWNGRNYILTKPYVKGYALNPQGIPSLSATRIEEH